MPTTTLVTAFETIYGPEYFSLILSSILYGVTCMQTFFYYVHYPNDSLPMKSFVAVIWALDTVHEALTISAVYKYIIAGVTNPASALEEIPDLFVNLIPELLVSLCAQGYFAYRFYVFSGKNIIAPLLWLIQAVYQIVAVSLFLARAVYSVDGTIRVVNFIVLGDSFFTGLTTSIFALDAAIDVLIAIGMTTLLLRKRNATRFTGTAHILQRCILFSVNTGTWPALFALLSFILLRAFPNTAYYVVFSATISSLYCNTLLANLNARTYIRAGATPHNAFMMHSMHTSNNSSGGKQSGEATFPSPQSAEVKFMDSNSGV